MGEILLSNVMSASCTIVRVEADMAVSWARPQCDMLQRRKQYKAQERRAWLRTELPEAAAATATAAAVAAAAAATAAAAAAVAVAGAGAGAVAVAVGVAGRVREDAGSSKRPRECLDQCAWRWVRRR